MRIDMDDARPLTSSIVAPPPGPPGKPVLTPARPTVGIVRLAADLKQADVAGNVVEAATKTKSIFATFPVCTWGVLQVGPLPEITSHLIRTRL